MTPGLPCPPSNAVATATLEPDNGGARDRSNATAVATSESEDVGTQHHTNPSAAGVFEPEDVSRNPWGPQDLGQHLRAHLGNPREIQ